MTRDVFLTCVYARVEYFSLNEEEVEEVEEEKLLRTFPRIAFKSLLTRTKRFSLFYFLSFVLSFLGIEEEEDIRSLYSIRGHTYEKV